jgi:hypothetical protein
MGLFQTLNRTEMDIQSKFKIIERFDTYYSGINNKGAFILAINTLIISGVLIGFSDLSAMITCSERNIFEILVTLIMVLSISSMIITIIAIIPYLKSTGSSVWFFNDVAKKSLVGFKALMQELSAEGLNSDLDEQIHYLASGLRLKHLRVKVALILNIIQMLLLLVLTYLLVF